MIRLISFLSRSLLIAVCTLGASAGNIANAVNLSLEDMNSCFRINSAFDGSRAHIYTLCLKSSKDGASVRVAHETSDGWSCEKTDQFTSSPSNVDQHKGIKIALATRKFLEITLAGDLTTGSAKMHYAGARSAMNFAYERSRDIGLYIAALSHCED